MTQRNVFRQEQNEQWKQCSACTHAPTRTVIELFLCALKLKNVQAGSGARGGLRCVYVCRAHLMPSMCLVWSFTFLKICLPPAMPTSRITLQTVQQKKTIVSFRPCTYDRSGRPLLFLVAADLATLSRGQFIFHEKNQTADITSSKKTFAK